MLYIDGEADLYYWYRAATQLGMRTFYVASRIQNPELLRRVRSKLTKDDEIELVTMNNPHGHGTLLLNFCRLDQSKKEEGLKVSIWPSAERRLRYLDKKLRLGSSPKVSAESWED